MTALGLSVKSLEEDGLIASAGRLGYALLFVPFTGEAGPEQIKELASVLNQAVAAGMKTCVDLDRRSLPSIKDLASGKGPHSRIDYLRLDERLSPAEAKRLLGGELPSGIALNASLITDMEIREWRETSCRLIGIHNYYPGPETGLSLEYVGRKNELLKAYRIPSYIFAGSREQGALPTLEKARECSAGQLAELIGSRIDLDGIIVADPESPEQLREYAQAFAGTEIRQTGTAATAGTSPIEVLTAVVSLKTAKADLIELLTGRIHELRPDGGEDCVRSLTSRAINTAGKLIAPENAAARPRGTITIENALSGRYSGEIRVMTRDLPARVSANIIGWTDCPVSRLLAARKIRFIVK